MITLTANVTTYGFKHATQIHIAGVTTPNTPIAEIRTAFFSPELNTLVPTVAYVDFTGFVYESFSAAFAATVTHLRHAGLDEVDYTGNPL